jgi:hypothetical protein
VYCVRSKRGGLTEQETLRYARPTRGVAEVAANHGDYGEKEKHELLPSGTISRDIGVSADAVRRNGSDEVDVGLFVLSPRRDNV